ncbi:MAG: glycosyltransferase family 4 protein [Gammaproteobacteria bacterium]
MSNRIKRTFQIVFVQRTPSQLDVPFYSELNRITGGAICLFYLNQEGLFRTKIDPELGVIPAFDLRYDFPVFHYQESCDFQNLLTDLKAAQPELVVLEDLPRYRRLRLALSLRRYGAKVILRTDNNFLSPQARTGFPLWLERMACHMFFNGIAPVSPLTSEYYAISDKSKTWPFPYMTDVLKFGRKSDYEVVRTSVRKQMSLTEDHFVFLAVTKLDKRENPLGILRAFSYVNQHTTRCSLILIGSGPLEAEVRAYAETKLRKNVILLGYIPYMDLPKYFFASDAFIHLAEFECWGSSPLDALTAHLGLVCSERTGVGQVFLTDDLRCFRVPHNDPEAAAKAMLRLATMGDCSASFAPAWQKASTEYTVQNVAKLWRDKIQTNADM